MTKIFAGNSVQAEDYIPSEPELRVSKRQCPGVYTKPSGTVSENITLSAAASVTTGDTTLLVDGIVPAQIPRSTTINFNGTTVDTADTTSAYERQINITSPASQIEKGEKSSTITTATNPSLIPILSANAADTQNNANEVNSRVFASQDDITRRIVTRDRSISVSGTFVKNDLGIQRIKDAYDNSEKVFFEIEEAYPRSTGSEGWAVVADFSRSRPNDDDEQVSFTLNVDGALYDLGNFDVSNI